VQARKARANAICDLLPGLQAKNWTGTVSDVSTELGGDKGILEIQLTDDIKVSTWNNSLSDIDGHTLIDPASKLYASLADLSEDDEVVFSGKFVHDTDCLSEQSVVDENGMSTPTFTFKFESVKAK